MKGKDDSLDFSLPFSALIVLSFVISFVLLSYNLGAGLVQAAAPITPSGLNTEISLSATPPTGHVQYDITGGTRPGGGTNLFHSFGDFNVPNNNIANFLNDSGLPTSNILGRVTGGDISNIFGTIQTTGFGNANLFLMNPNGFLFGQNATVNVGGIVSFTTADYLRLSNGTNNGNFYADPAGPSLLTAAPVAAFGFLGPNAASIAIQGGALEVADGRTLSFIGGPRSFTTDTGATVPSGVTMTGGSLSAPNGLIYMATVASPGEIPVPTLSSVPLGALGPPSTDPAVIRIRSGEFVMDHAFLLSTNSGNTALSAIDVTVQDTMTLRSASSISTETFGAGHGSDLHIAAQSFQMDGSSVKSSTTGDGHGGNISITNAQTVTLTNGAQIVSSSVGAADGGDITVSAIESIGISGYASTGILNGVTTFLIDPNSSLPLVTSGIFTTTVNGIGGNIEVSSITVNLENAGTFATLTSGSGNGGSVSVTGGTISLHDGGLLFSSTDGAGAGGAITVNPQESVTMSGIDANGNPSMIFSTATVMGKGGDISISAPTVAIDSASILSSASGDAPGGKIAITNANDVTLRGLSIVLSSTDSSQPGGEVFIEAERVRLEDGSLIWSTHLGPGLNGKITVDATESLIVTGVDEGENPSSVLSEGGGTIDIHAPSVTLMDRGTIRTTFVEGSPEAGTITLHADNNLSLLSGGAIESIGGSTGAITIDAPGTLLLSGLGNSIQAFAQSRISNLVRGPGPNGGIAIQTGTFLQTDGARIISELVSAGSDSVTPGASGNVTIQASDSITLRGGSRMSLLADLGDVASLDLSAPSITIEGQGTGLSTVTGGPGKGGDITLTATTGNLTLTGGSTIESMSFDIGTAGSIKVGAENLVSLSGTGTGFFSEARGSGPGGAITMLGNQVQLADGAVISAKTSGTGVNATGGTITVDATNTVTMNSASITASSAGTADAGSIKITSPNGFTMHNSTITTQAGQGASGGNIKVTTSPESTVWLQNSKISASVADGRGGGGNISIDPQFVILQNSQILAQAAQGQGGAITITTSLFLQDANSIVNADSGSGVNGTVTIQSPNAPISGQIQPLGKSPLLATSLLNQRCAALAGGDFSSFTVAGRDSLPTEPGSWLASPLYAAGVGEGQGVRGEGLEGAAPILSLRQIAPAGFLTQAFAVDMSSSCQS